MAELDPAPFPSGYRFSRYVIEHELAPGELGRVYKAIDTALGVVVALNVLDAEHREDGKRRMRMGLKRERQKAKPQAFEYGEWQGIPFVVVEYVEGVGAAVDIGKS